MAISLDRLPQEKPQGMGEYPLPLVGFHKATIEKAEFVAGAEGKSDYINLTLLLADGSKVWDKLFNSDKPAPAYKLARIIRAAGIPLTGTLTLQDLARVLTGKQIVVDIKHAPHWKEKEKTVAEVNMFEHDIFYLTSEYASLVNAEAEGTPFEVDDTTETNY